jgi:hypothetical protein
MRLPLALGLAVLTVAGCVVVEPEGRLPAPPPGPVTAPPSFKIPPGHMPPAGLCRVWIPGRPPGHQSPPGRCEDLQYQVPAGGYLIRG